MHSSALVPHVAMGWTFSDSAAISELIDGSWTAAGSHQGWMVQSLAQPVLGGLGCGHIVHERVVQDAQRDGGALRQVKGRWETVRCSCDITMWDDAALHMILGISNAELLPDTEPQRAGVGYLRPGHTVGWMLTLQDGLGTEL